jgi:hypothetical protein
MGYSSFVELIPPEKNKEMCGDRQVKRPEPGTPHVEEDPGWSLLELISRRPGRRRNEDGKAMRIIDWGRFCCRHAWRPSRSAGVASPCPRSFSLQAIPLRSVRAKEKTSTRVSHTQPMFEALIFPLAYPRLRVRREGKVVILKSRIKRLHRPSGKINF